MGYLGSSDHYGVLGVTRDASTREIRRAYRRLARQHHPDLNPRPDGPERFAALACAYAILSDPTTRARYDRTLRQPVPSSRPPRHGRGRPTPRAGQRPYATGILELSAREADQLTRSALTLTDANGRTIVRLPAGIGRGDQIALNDDGRTLVLRVVVP